MYALIDFSGRIWASLDGLRWSARGALPAWSEDALRSAVLVGPRLYVLTNDDPVRLVVSGDWGQTWSTVHSFAASMYSARNGYVARSPQGRVVAAYGNEIVHGSGSGPWATQVMPGESDFANVAWVHDRFFVEGTALWASRDGSSWASSAVKMPVWDGSRFMAPIAGGIGTSRSLDGATWARNADAALLLDSFSLWSLLGGGGISVFGVDWSLAYSPDYGAVESNGGDIWYGVPPSGPVVARVGGDSRLGKGHQGGKVGGMVAVLPGGWVMWGDEFDVTPCGSAMWRSDAGATWSKMALPFDRSFGGFGYYPGGPAAFLQYGGGAGTYLCDGSSFTAVTNPGWDQAEYVLYAADRAPYNARALVGGGVSEFYGGGSVGW